MPPLTGSWERATARPAPQAPPRRACARSPSIPRWPRRREDVVLAHLNHPLVAMSTRLLRAAVWNADNVDLHRVTAVVSDDPALETTLVGAYARFVLVGARRRTPARGGAARGGWLRRHGGVRALGNLVGSPRSWTARSPRAAAATDACSSGSPQSWPKTSASGARRGPSDARDERPRESLRTAWPSAGPRRSAAINATLDRFAARRCASRSPRRGRREWRTPGVLHDLATTGRGGASSTRTGRRWRARLDGAGGRARAANRPRSPPGTATSPATSSRSPWSSSSRQDATRAVAASSRRSAAATARRPSTAASSTWTGWPSSRSPARSSPCRCSPAIWPDAGRDRQADARPTAARPRLAEPTPRAGRVAWIGYVRRPARLGRALHRGRHGSRQRRPAAHRRPVRRQPPGSMHRRADFASSTAPTAPNRTRGAAEHVDPRLRPPPDSRARRPRRRGRPGRRPGRPARRACCRHHGVELGLVTDGRWWAWSGPRAAASPARLSSTPSTWTRRPTGSSSARSSPCWAAPGSRGHRRRDAAALLAESLDGQEEITEALGVQVRQAVELLVDAIGRGDARTRRARREPDWLRRDRARGLPGRGHGDDARGVPALRRGARPAARRQPSVRARPTGSARLLRRARDSADAGAARTASSTPPPPGTGCSPLFHAVYGGVDHPRLRMPAYDGSIFDPSALPVAGPTRSTPLPSTTAPCCTCSSRCSTSVGTARSGAGCPSAPSTSSRSATSTRACSRYDGTRADETVLGLVGKAGLEHEVRCASWRHWPRRASARTSPPGSTAWPAENVQGLEDSVSRPRRWTESCSHRWPTTRTRREAGHRCSPSPRATATWPSACCRSRPPPRRPARAAGGDPGGAACTSRVRARARTPAPTTRRGSSPRRSSRAPWSRWCTARARCRRGRRATWKPHGRRRDPRAQGRRHRHGLGAPSWSPPAATSPTDWSRPGPRRGRRDAMHYAAADATDGRVTAADAE